MPALLELDAVSKAFGRVVVADSVSLAVDAGETVGIVGPNGAGKTSLLNLISGNLTPDAGQIRFEGRDVTNIPSHVRAKSGIARTYQIPQPFGGMTVYENVLLGASFAGAARADAPDPATAAVSALDRTRLMDRANQPAGALPLLDRKRLELARALATRPRLLLLDEIAGGLVEHEVEDLISTIRDLRDQGVTIVWIEHVVPALMAVVDRLVAMTMGRILMDGEPTAVMADPAVQAEYLGAVEVVS
jgi:branched-chain amino acid transport system ATP-binding protein